MPYANVKYIAIHKFSVLFNCIDPTCSFVFIILNAVRYPSNTNFNKQRQYQMVSTNVNQWVMLRFNMRKNRKRWTYLNICWLLSIVPRLFMHDGTAQYSFRFLKSDIVKTTFPVALYLLIRFNYLHKLRWSGQNTHNIQFRHINHIVDDFTVGNRIRIRSLKRLKVYWPYETIRVSAILLVFFSIISIKKIFFIKNECTNLERTFEIFYLL